MSGSVRVVDRGWARIEREARNLRLRSVRVGIRAGRANGGVEVVDYALFNEFGTRDIPSRPFMRRTADLAQPDLSNFARAQLGAMMDGGINVQVLLNRIGLWFRERMQATIRDAPSWAEPLSEATEGLKGSTVPLIDKGFLHNSVDYEIR